MREVTRRIFSHPTPPPTGLPRRAVFAVASAAVGTLLVEYGFSLPAPFTLWLRLLEGLLAALFVTDRVLSIMRAPERWALIRQRKFEYLVLLLFLGLSLVMSITPAAVANLTGWLYRDSPQTLGLDLLKLFLLANVLIQLLRLHQRFLGQGLRPEWILPGSFALLILAGTLLLLLPRANAVPQKPMSLIDALFTSTSASCVTGLAIRDTNTQFSSVGQLVILALIQVGGLGIMTFVAFLAVNSAGSLPLAQMLAFRQTIGARSLARVKQQVWTIVVFTALVEGIGALCLYTCLPAHQAPSTRLWWSTFHSVSAFCNAGFALQADSLTAFQDRGGAMLTFMGLITLGSLGFLVVMDLIALQISRLPGIRRIPWVSRYNQRHPVYRLPVQTRLSAIMTVLLIGVGLLGFWILEAGNILHDKPLGAQFWISTFQSVTSRTAGFNTVPIDQLQSGTQLLIIALMVIGACPVSTGGGVKTVTLGVLLLAVRALILGRDRVEVFGRTLPPKVILAALTVFLLYILVAGVTVFGLALFDPRQPLHGELFEAVSALSTVGLSTGITSQLSTGSKLILCAAMFIGRVGPISLVLAMFRPGPPVRYQYPEEDLMVG